MLIFKIDWSRTWVSYLNIRKIIKSTEKIQWLVIHLVSFIWNLKKGLDTVMHHQCGYTIFCEGWAVDGIDFWIHFVLSKTVLHTIGSMAISMTLYRKWILWWEKLIDYCTLITVTPKNSFLVWIKFFPYNFYFSSHFQMLPLHFFSFQLQSLPWT